MSATDTSPTTSPHHGAAQSPAESIAFIEAFARINVAFIRDRLSAQPRIPPSASPSIAPDWDDPALLSASGLTAAQVDVATRSGLRYLHIDVTMAAAGAPTRQLLLR